MIGGLGVPELLIILGYFVPTLIAIKRKHPQKGSLIALNILLGWTGILWAVAFIWALWNYEKSDQKNIV